jgi:hypothetical protein
MNNILAPPAASPSFNAERAALRLAELLILERKVNRAAALNVDQARHELRLAERSRDKWALFGLVVGVALIGMSLLVVVMWMGK